LKFGGPEALFAVRRGEEARLSGEDLLALLVDGLARGASLRFRAGGASMSPFIRDGDVLTIAPLTGRPRTGAVAAYIRPETGALAVHRVIGRTRAGILLKGDNERGRDLVPESSLLGLLVRAERKGRPVRIGGAVGRLIAGLSRWGALPRLYWAAQRVRAAFRPRPS
jgi:hypothetical protein